MKLYFDTETSGLDPLKHQILTAALLIEDSKENVIYEKEFKIKLQDWSIIDDYALKVNKINLEQHNKEAIKEIDFIEEIYNVLKSLNLFRPQLIGQNLTFDLGFLNALYLRNGIKGHPFNYHYQDTMILGNTLLDVGLISVPNLKLETLSKYFRITQNFHNALEDVKATRAVYKKMLSLINPKLFRIYQNGNNYGGESQRFELSVLKHYKDFDGVIALEITEE